MARPKGWKPLNYRTLAEISARVTLGQGLREISARYGVTDSAVRHIQDCLLAAELIERTITPKRLPDEVHRQIAHLVRTTMLTNHQIRRKLDLKGATVVRTTRKRYHDELRAAGREVRQCECGDEFQHAHRCRFMSNCAKPIDDFHREEIVRLLVDGTSVREICEEYQVGYAPCRDLLSTLSARQKAKRLANINAARAAARRRTMSRSFSEKDIAKLRERIGTRLPEEVRDEVLQSMSLDIMGGVTTVEGALARKSKYISSSYHALGDRWKTISIDEERDGMAFGDLLEDESALIAFDELDEMAL